ncbi:hypothetical protein ACOYXF_23790 [Pseudomonas sp. Tul1A2]
MTRTLTILCLISISLIQGCSHSPVETDPVNSALKSCGMGLSTQTAYVFKTAFEVAEKKGSADFSLSMNQSVDTQEASLLKQMDKSPDSTKAILGEVKSFRECVIAQSAALRPASRLDLLEQCRVNIQNRISPPGNTSYGTLRYWNQRPKDPRYTNDVPIMGGIFDNGPGFPVLVQCDIRNGKLQDAMAIENP